MALLKKDFELPPQFDNLRDQTEALITPQGHPALVERAVIGLNSSPFAKAV
jgi:hypothetical protein